MTESSPRAEILFASPHCLIDSSSGAVLATLDQLKLLCWYGFVAKAVCASKLDSPGEADFEQSLADMRVKFQVYEMGQRAQRTDPSPVASPRKRGEGAFYLMRQGELPVTVLRTRSTRVDVEERKRCSLCPQGEFFDFSGQGGLLESQVMNKLSTSFDQ